MNNGSGEPRACIVCLGDYQGDDQAPNGQPGGPLFCSPACAAWAHDLETRADWPPHMETHDAPEMPS